MPVMKAFMSAALRHQTFKFALALRITQQHDLLRTGCKRRGEEVVTCLRDLVDREWQNVHRQPGAKPGERADHVRAVRALS